MHVAIVLDGNRRYAKKLGKKPWEGHIFGLKKVLPLLEWSRDLGITELTLYAFSLDNFKRSEIEKRALLSLFDQFSQEFLDDAFLKQRIRLRFLGRTELFPEAMQKGMRSLEEKTAANSTFILNLAMAYSGRAEIVDAVKKAKEITEETVQKNLYQQNDVDIFIRPGGEKRLSDFLLWQSAYAELFFLDKLWPEMEKEDLEAVIAEFKQRERRFGK